MILKNINGVITNLNINYSIRDDRFAVPLKQTSSSIKANG